MADQFIRAENLGKSYKIVRGKKRVMLRQVIEDTFTSNIDRIKSFYKNDVVVKQKSANSVFWALRDVSFNVKAGESIGIIGANGAGKSTLLKILARVTAPTSGKVRMRGRVGSLLEVGTGFHSELTGRENIYLNGAVLGMRRHEIDRKFDEIVAFSGVEEFLDNPVKFYSSGMRMRLAFSVAAHLEPEILFIDEVLAVGDTAFQKKSIQKMEAVIREGRIVLFVSHNLAVVRSLCKKGLYLEHGQTKHFGEMSETINVYLNSNETKISGVVRTKPNLKKDIQIMEVEVIGSDKNAGVFPNDKPLKIRIKVAVRKPLYQSALSLTVLDNEFNSILTSYDFDKSEEALQQKKTGTYNYIIKIPPILTPANYSFSVQALRLSKTRQLGQKTNYIADSLENICPIELFDNGSPRSRINISSKGLLSLPITWTLNKIMQLENI